MRSSINALTLRTEVVASSEDSTSLTARKRAAGLTESAIGSIDTAAAPIAVTGCRVPLGILRGPATTGIALK